jgi:carboxylesterase type B
MNVREMYEYYAAHQDVLDRHLDHVLNVKESRLPDHLASQAGEYYEFAKLYAVANYEFQKAKHNAEEVVLRDCKNRARRKLTEANTRVTEERVLDAALTDPAYQRAVEQMLRAQYMKEKFAEARAAIAMRADALRSLNARHCKEFVFYEDENERLSQIGVREKRACQLKKMREDERNGIESGQGEPDEESN